MPESSVPNEIAPASWPADDDPPGEWPNAHLDTDGREGDDDRDEITPQPADDGWRRMFIEVRQVFEVHVDAEAYGDTEDANDDTELHEYLCDPMRLVEGEIVGVVTDPRLVATYAETSVECCCSVEDGGTYCGQPECDIYYCQDCGDEFSEPCRRHEGVNHE